MTPYDERYADRWIAAAVLDQSEVLPEDAVKFVAGGLRIAERQGISYALPRNQAPALHPALISAGNPDEAFAEFLIVTEKRQAFGDLRLEAKCLHALGIAFYFQTEYLRAFRYLYRAADLSRASEDDSELLSILQRLADFNVEQSNYVEAATILAEALTISGRLNRRGVEARLLSQLGLCKIETGDRAAAIPVLERAARISDAASANDSTFDTLIRLARAQRLSGVPLHAVGSASRASEVAKTTARPEDESRAAIAFSRATAAAGEYPIESLVQVSMRLFGAREFDASLGEDALELGELHLKQNNLVDARSVFEQGLAVSIALNEKSVACRLHQEISVVCAAEGDLAAALAHQEASQNNEEVIRRRVAQCRTFVEMAKRDAELRRHEAVVHKARIAEISRLREAAQADLALNAMASRNGVLPRLSVEDALTGLYNRRYISDFLEMEIDRSRRTCTPLTVTIADIDDFHLINDCFSHRVGDTVLRTVAEIFASYVRREDIVARYGGEEFVAVHPGADRTMASVICERVRSAVEDFPWQRIHPELRVTISIGVADEKTKCVEDLLYIADQRLGQAKRSGKNRLM